MVKVAAPQRQASPFAGTISLRPLTKRLGRMEAILLEMRHSQDLRHKQLVKLEGQLDALTDRVTANTVTIQRLARSRKVGKSKTQ